MGSLLYALACVLVPMAWGLLMVWVIGWVERKLGIHASVQDDQG